MSSGHHAMTASALSGRCPLCRTRIHVPWDWEFSWHVCDDPQWVRRARRIIYAHAEFRHPDEMPWWDRDGITLPRRTAT